MRWIRGVVVGLAAMGFAAVSEARQVSAQSGQFLIVQVATRDPDRLMASWNTPGDPPRLETQNSARRGETLEVFIIFQGCKGDAAGACRVTADYEVRKPDGSLYANVKGAEIYRGKQASPATFLMSGSSLGLRFEPQDPLGGYTVKATVTDRVAGVSVSTEQVLTATD